MNRVALLDVNVLMALVLPDHVHHELAHDWFAENRRSGWATCPITETGFVRLLTNPRVQEGAIPIGEVIGRLRRMQSDSAHQWWAANVSFTDSALFRPTAMRGHRQVTDLYLAGLAHSRAGKLVTFDRGVMWNAVVDAEPSLVEVLSLADA